MPRDDLARKPAWVEGDMAAEIPAESHIRVLVCVTGQKTCERLIQEGARIAEQLDGKVSVVHVAPKGAAILGNHREGEALEYLFRTADDVGADMTVLRAGDAMDTLVAFAREQQVDCIVVGTARGREGGDFAERLRMRLPNVEIRSVYAQ
ncbi:MAG: universal stress protein [Clostridia bacterium]|nr:universal stress protein [Clostridia bacterium]